MLLIVSPRSRREHATAWRRLTCDSTTSTKYDVRDKATVNFATGSAGADELTTKPRLDAIAAKAVTQEGYLVEVTGYTDIRRRRER